MWIDWNITPPLSALSIMPSHRLMRTRSVGDAVSALSHYHAITHILYIQVISDYRIMGLWLGNENDYHLHLARYEVWPIA